MSNSSDSEDNPVILGHFASAMAILAFFLYFTGWIYRWAYFAFFQLEVTSIDFSVESFFFVPLQVFFGNIQAIIINLIILSVIILLIWQVRRSHFTRHFIGFPPFFKDLIVVGGILLLIFWIARHQGTIDARRDAIDKTSLLPVVTFATPKNLLPLGRNPDDIPTIPPLEDYKLIGDVKNWEYLQVRDTNDTEQNNPRVWRLLLQNRGWIYLFPGLPVNAPSEQRPPILAIAASGNGDQLMILAPETIKKSD